jgi:serine/threonine-protein kinase RsbW
LRGRENMTADKRISLRIDSRLDYVSLIGVATNALCREHGMDEMNSYRVQTAITEAINNAIIHAYENQPGHTVTADWILQDNVIRVEVADQGKSMVGMPPDIEPSPEAESGRGWWIMRRWMDHADYASSDGFNRVIMSRKI